MRSLSWYIKRAGVMHPREMLHRVGEHVDMARLRNEHRLGGRRFKTVKQPNDFRFCVETSEQLPSLSWDFHLTDDEILRLVDGQWPALGFPWKWEPDSYVWSRAPDTGKAWPSAFFGSIPYQVGNPFGDIRVAWEPSRLQQLVSQALLARHDASHAEKAVELLEAMLASWVETNPPLTGIHYISAMECALRLIAACHALDLVRPRLKTAERTWTSLLRLVVSHATLITRRLSLYSSAGNHTVAEGCGLVYAGILFPEFPDATKWKAVGMYILEQEAARQVLPDGGGIEQALGYQHLVIDLLGLVQALLEYRGEPVPDAIASAVCNGRTFLNAFGQSQKNLPSIGDCDGGYALSRHLRISWDRDAERTVDQITFADSGYTIFHGHSPSRLRLILDHGALGMSPCFGHGHADALSVILNCGDQDILVDPGTYTYAGDQIWRTYFRGTRAHNTVAVDNLDQAVQEPAFMWTQPYLAQLVFKEESPSGAVTILASHDGYEKRVGVTHWRAVLYDPPHSWLIWDRLVGNGVHHLELNWHLGIEPSVHAGLYVFDCAEDLLHLTVDGGESVLHLGETALIRGWRSRHYGIKEPMATLLTEYTGSLPHEFATRIWIGAGAVTAEPTFARLSVVQRLVDEIETLRNPRCVG